MRCLMYTYVRHAERYQEKLRIALGIQRRDIAKLCSFRGVKANARENKNEHEPRRYPKFYGCADISVAWGWG